jgi:DNA repair protein RecN (Recombination protein N)
LEKVTDIDPGLGVFKDVLAEVEVKLEDVSLSMRDYQKQIHMDPSKLEKLEERLEALNRLKRKYGPALEDVLQYKNQLAATIYDLDEKREKLDRLIQNRKELETELMRRASTLSKGRKAAAGRFENAVEKELQDLHMAETRFMVKFGGEATAGKGAPKEVKVEDLKADGIDRVEFMISPNIGEDLKPLAKVASGGELSRIMLALKTILARTASVETIVFDEVDSGISGATAEVIGEKLSSLAKYHQILCITHLPQIASQGQSHFLVRKEVAGGRTQTIISGLEPEARVQEIARLLGGKQITASAVAHARQMLG